MKEMGKLREKINKNKKNKNDWIDLGSIYE